MKLLQHEQQHLETIYPHMGEFTVLLKKNGDFPLKEAGEIALYGNGGRQTIKGGTGSGEVNSRFFISCEEGLKNKGFHVLTSSWLDAYDEIRKKFKEEFIRDIKKTAKKNHTNTIAASMGKVMKEGDYELGLKKECDTAIYVLSRISGEGNDRLAQRGDYKLSETEIRDLKRLQEEYDKFMLVINAGGPVDLSEADFVENILVLSQLGVETGNALADILLGKLYPSGKLATTWDAYENYCHAGDFGDKDDTHYKEGIYVGYRYFDSVGKKALYPFGHGLGYADMRYAVDDVSLNGKTCTIKAEVKNLSDTYAGKEALQVYLSKPQGRLDQPYQELCAFEKTKELKPKEDQKLTLRFDLDDFASYDTERHSYVLEKGDYIVRVGNSSIDSMTACVIEVREDLVTRVVKNCLGDCGFKDLLIERKDEKAGPEVPRFVLNEASVQTQVIDYDTEDPVCEELKDVPLEKLALLNIGAFDPKGGLMSVIGNAAVSVAGAAGESSDVFKDKGLKSIVMSDGPAGLRISKHYYFDKKGVMHGVGAAIPETVLDFLPGILRWVLNRSAKIPKGVDVFEQWCTAIPIGTAIAQSFNKDIAYLLGDIVGKEMEIYKIDLWLAPALNIHRNVLCGRNFEYFSEDPLVSGVMAACLSKGVQSHEGKGVTVKHYAANNQETNRYGNNSLVSERAMREIYLRGFEYCIKNAGPFALMSSYNLLNGTHTSEHQGLCTDILRKEWGYEGIVMTDWVVATGMLSKDAKYPSPSAAKVAAASHSLFMPGSKKDYDDLLAGLKDGRVSKKQLQINGSRLFRIFKQ
ncbi:MAG: glycoside hydrolase family 3 C-terminal domain-containing protein [Erysipelotrichaceae bacterium]|nr:glycoside hydrolase family 3 C-terminal domain-containing protein [Erysipelotrichaceae bacterium]